LLSQVVIGRASVLGFGGFFCRVFGPGILGKPPKSNLALFLKTAPAFAIEAQPLFSGEMAD
jgi:hypothetical protein